MVDVVGEVEGGRCRLPIVQGKENNYSSINCTEQTLVKNKVSVFIQTYMYVKIK